eukprot:m.111529 g.111529  ORF g.111529 m.111529 type:complete len:623 (-) comp9235_c0_seq2:276-2144(-)
MTAPTWWWSGVFVGAPSREDATTSFMLLDRSDSDGNRGEGEKCQCSQDHFSMGYWESVCELSLRSQRSDVGSWTGALSDQPTPSGKPFQVEHFSELGNKLMEDQVRREDDDRDYSHAVIGSKATNLQNESSEVSHVTIINNDDGSPLRKRDKPGNLMDFGVKSNCIQHKNITNSPSIQNNNTNTIVCGKTITDEMTLDSFCKHGYLHSIPPTLSPSSGGFDRIVFAQLSKLSLSSNFVSFCATIVQIEPSQQIVTRDGRHVQLSTVFVSDETKDFFKVVLWGKEFALGIMGSCQIGNIAMFKNMRLQIFKGELHSSSSSSSSVHIFLPITNMNSMKGGIHQNSQTLLSTFFEENCTTKLLIMDLIQWGKERCLFPFGKGHDTHPTSPSFSMDDDISPKICSSLTVSQFLRKQKKRKQVNANEKCQRFDFEDNSIVIYGQIRRIRFTTDYNSPCVYFGCLICGDSVSREQGTGLPHPCSQCLVSGLSQGGFMHGWMLPAMVLTLLDAKRLPSVGNHNVGNKSDNNEDESDDNDNDVLFSTPSEIIDGLDVKLFAPLATKLFLSPSCTEMDAKEQFMFVKPKIAFCLFFLMESTVEREFSTHAITFASSSLGFYSVGCVLMSLK